MMLYSFMFLGIVDGLLAYKGKIDGSEYCTAPTQPDGGYNITCPDLFVGDTVGAE